MGAAVTRHRRHAMPHAAPVTAAGFSFALLAACLIAATTAAAKLLATLWRR